MVSKLSNEGVKTAASAAWCSLFGEGKVGGGTLYKSYFLMWPFHPLWLRGGCLEGPEADNPHWKFSLFACEVRRRLSLPSPLPERDIQPRSWSLPYLPPPNIHVRKELITSLLLSLCGVDTACSSVLLVRVDKCLSLVGDWTFWHAHLVQAAGGGCRMGSARAAVLALAGSSNPATA